MSLLLRAAGSLVVVCAALIVCVTLAGRVLTGAGQLVYMARHVIPNAIQLGGETGSLHALDLATGISTPIVRRGVGTLFFPSPDGTQIAFYRGGGIAPDIYVINIDGSNLRHLDAADMFVGWMPDSTQLLTSDNLRQSTRYINTSDGSSTALTAAENLSCAFALSPDAQFIAYQILRDYGQPMNARLCVGVAVNRMGSIGTHSYLTDNQQMFPVWSPDSRQLALLNNFSLYIVPDVTQDAALEVRDARMRVPISSLRWSLDSRRIAFAADVTFDIFVVDVQPQLGDARNVTNTASVESYPAWLPSGHEIAFTSTRDDLNSEIYVMNDDGSNVRRLTVNDDVEHNLVWLP